ncbi:MAG: OadG family protein [Eggerthellaceae bacterium]|jgi:Na+-transporting methylmalonyl-CoA/oxaloacetate decarboxylase gamma subunit|nr:OadG family protein [Eggerthellaceae bacterium]
MSVVDYWINSLLGVCVVFFALILLIVIILILTKLQLSDEPDKPKDAVSSAVVKASADDEPVKPLAPGSAGDLKLYNTDPRDAAMIMAIVADELQKPINELRFLSIREITPEKD